MNAIERFWSKVDKSGDCWLWTSTVNASGYGVFGYGVPHQMRLAHRLAWLFTFGVEPDGFALHRCDTPACVNPAHLFLGTQADNLAEMRRKGRERHARGEEAGKAKLTRQQVLAIRRSTLSQRALGALYGVSNTSIRSIQLRRSWAWLSDEEAA